MVAVWRVRNLKNQLIPRGLFKTTNRLTPWVPSSDVALQVAKLDQSDDGNRSRVVVCLSWPRIGTHSLSPPGPTVMPRVRLILIFPVLEIFSNISFLPNSAHNLSLSTFRETHRHTHTFPRYPGSKGTRLIRVDHDPTQLRVSLCGKHMIWISTHVLHRVRAQVRHNSNEVSLGQLEVASQDKLRGEIALVWLENISWDNLDQGGDHYKKFM
ncbi:hypothetical protein OSB04_006400 [Centaurea solstitialis]|uniref:Uncharacterized protein n=1 Tax=Centaurea solstitialis TaxID=347529 RepID=A0AA38THV1_9ASTR|nr:hypothetical protein OSB04_006400 [Centaurea solstitialis]